MIELEVNGRSEWILWEQTRELAARPELDA